MIYDDYIDYCDQFTHKYGPNTVVFMQVGDFFELYAVQNEQERKGADIYRVCELCNIQVSRKNKSVLENSRQNPLMAGFPIATISKFIQIMVQNNYTCILIRQVTLPPNPKREVTEIISPSTTLQVQSNEGSYLMVIYWELSKDISTQRELLHAGISAIDITTGKSWIYEAYSTNEDTEFSKDEVQRFISSYQPKELVHIGSVTEDVQEELETLFCNVKNVSIHRIWNSEKVKPFQHTSYQNTILEKVFGKGLLTPLESLQLERSFLATVAYCYMIQFAYEHNETIVQKIEYPVPWKNQKHLVLEATSAYQLNVISNTQGETPLMSILNRTSTAFGSRLFRERLLYPILCKKELEKRYQHIELFQQENLYQDIGYQMSSILDLERLSRRIGLGKLLPCEWLGLHTSLETAKKVFEKLQKKLPECVVANKQLEAIMKEYQTILNLEECSKYNLSDIYTSLFHEGIYSDLDEITDALKKGFSFIDELRIRISGIGSGESTLCRLDCNEKEGYHLTITKKRWEAAMQLCPKQIVVQGETIYWKDCKVKPISSSSSILRLSHPKMDEFSDNIIVLQRKMSALNIEYYKTFLATFYEKFHTYFTCIVQLLAEIDVSCTNAKNSIEYHYYKPTIVESKHSYLRAKELRHPIIERLSIRTEYISNDIELGTSKKGLLLYGINASGKSSFMKSIGLNVMMAQAGMFVSATSFELAPYQHLFTRISGMDNIYRGLSTFTVEMLELKNILNRCDENSLILGDELCAGTEGVSAISIVAAGIHELTRKQTTYIFATHLHELLDIEFIQQEPRIQVSHMHIELDEKTGKIIYDRTLKDGNGSSLYGLEVCRFLKMTPEFLNVANTIRKKIQRVPLYLVDPKTSKYNTNVYVSECSLCGNPASETHHIRMQKDADRDGYIQNVHKDHLSNLLVLCEECHKKQHHGKTKIEKKILTSEGIEVVEKIVDVSVEREQDTTMDMGLKQYLMYDIQGWKYRTDITQKWKKLLSSQYLNVFKKLQKIEPQLPQSLQMIQCFLEEHKSDYFSFAQ